MTLEERLIALESRLAHFERMADDLSDVIARQDRALEIMAHRQTRLIERLRLLEGGLERSPQDDRPPPHY
ncbi:protein SlyX [mine drainage metagenome]|uniref:Protein SlyX n=1 Tax=mine drainage metagenome TaxID=410659 RepID=A0A1J5SE05_9ZZZZ